MTIAFIIKGSERSKHLFRRYLSDIKSIRGSRIKLLFTSVNFNATQLVEFVSYYDVIFAVGGDGTVNEVVNGIIRYCDLNKTKFAILPNGTGNDTIRTFYPNTTSIRPNGFDFFSSKEIDVGEVVFSDGNKKYFINVLDIGFGSTVVEKVEQLKQWYVKSDFIYNLAIVSSFFSYRRKEICLRVNNKEITNKFLSVVIANGKSFGNQLIISPESKLNDGLLNVILLKNISLVEFVRYLPSLKKGKLIKHPEIEYLTSNSISFNKLNQCAELDGEYEKRTITEVRLAKFKLKILDYKS